MDLNLAHAQIAVRKKLLEDVSPLQIVAPTQIKDHQQKDQIKDQSSSAVRSADSLTKAEVKRVLDRFQPLTPLLKTALEGAHALRQGFQDLKNLTRDQAEPPIVAASPVTSNQPISPIQPKGLSALVTSPVTHPEIATAQQLEISVSAQPKTTEKSGSPAKAEDLRTGSHVQGLVGLKAPEVENDRPVVNAQALRPEQSGQSISPIKLKDENHPITKQGNRFEEPAAPQKSKTAVTTQSKVIEKLGGPAKAENLPPGGHVQVPPPFGVKAPEATHGRPVVNAQTIRPTQPGQSISPTQLKDENHPVTGDKRSQQVTASQTKNAVTTEAKATDKLDQPAKAENLPAGGNAQAHLSVGVKAPETTTDRAGVNAQAIRPIQPGQPVSPTQPKGENSPITLPVNHPEPTTATQPKPSISTPPVADKLGQAAKPENPPAGGIVQMPPPVGVRSPETTNDRTAVTAQTIRPTQPEQPISPTKPKAENQPLTSSVNHPEQTLAPQPSKPAVTTQVQATDKLGQPAKAENLPAGGHVQVPPPVGVKAPETTNDHPVVNAQAIRPIQQGQPISSTRSKDENQPFTASVNHPEQTMAPQHSKTVETTKTQATERSGQTAKAENLPAGGQVQTPSPVGIKTPEATNDLSVVNERTIRPTQAGQPISPIQPEGKNKPSGIQTVGGGQKLPSHPGEVGKANQVSVGTTKQPADHENVPAGGNPQAPVAITPRLPQTTEKISGSAPQAILPSQKGQAIQPGKVETNTLSSASKRTGEHRTITAQNVNLPVNIPLAAEKAVPPPSVLSTEPPISAVPGAQGPLSAVAQSQIQGTRPLVIPPGAPVGGELIATGLTKDQAIQTFQRNLREAGARTTIEEARKTTDLLQQHPLVNAQPVVLTTPQTLVEKMGSTDETVTRLAGPVPNRPNLGAEIVARTPVRGDNRASTEPIGKAERRELGPQNGSRLPARPPAHAVPPLLNVNSQLRQPLPTNARSRLVAVPTVNLLDLSL